MLDVKLKLDKKETLQLSIKDKTVNVKVIDYMQILKTPQLVKIGLKLKSFSKGNYDIRISKGFFKNIFKK